MTNLFRKYTIKISRQDIKNVTLREYLTGIQKSFDAESVKAVITSDSSMLYEDNTVWYKKSRGSSTKGVKGDLKISEDDQNIYITYSHTYLRDFLFSQILFFCFTYFLAHSITFYFVTLVMTSFGLWWNFFSFNSIIIGGIKRYT